MSNMDVVNKLIRAAASVSDSVTDAELDKHVADMLKAEAKAKELQWSELGLSALLGGNNSRSPDPSLPRPNKRFLSSIIRTVDDHNAALLRQQAIAARDARIEKGHAPGVGPRASGASRLFGGAMNSVGMRSKWNDEPGSSRRRWDDDGTRSGDRSRREDEGSTRSREQGGSSTRSRRDEDESTSRRSRRDEDEYSSRRSNRDEDESTSRRSQQDGDESRSRRSRRDEDESSSRRSKRDENESASRRSRQDSQDRTHRSKRDDGENRDLKSSSRRDDNGKRSSRYDDELETKSKSKRAEDGNRSHHRDRERHKHERSASPKRHKRPPSPEDDIPPPPPDTPPPPPPLPPSKMDKYFNAEYDPRLDLAPIPKEGMIPEVAWDAMLAVLKERGKKKRKQSPGLSDDEFSTNISARPFSSHREREYEHKSSSKRSEEKEHKRKIKEQRKRHGFSDSDDDTAAAKASASAKNLLDMSYSKKGAVREWDVGK